MKTVSQPLQKAQNRESQPESAFLAITPFYRALIIGILIIYLLAIGLQGLLVLSSVSSVGWVFLALVLQCILLAIPFLFYRPTYGWLHPLIFSILFALVNHLRRTDTYLNGLQWHMALPGWDAHDLTPLVVYEGVLRSVALVAYYLGFFLCPTPAIPKLTFGKPRYLGFKTLLAVLFSTGIFLAYMQSRGGVVSHLLSWARGRNVELAGEFYWQILIQSGLIACLLWFAIDRKVFLQPLFWGCTGISFITTFLSGGSRSSVIFIVMMALLVWILRERQVDPVKIVTIAVIGLLLFGALGNFRNSTATGEVDWKVLIGASTGTESDTSAIASGLDEAAMRGTVVAGVFPILALVPQQVNFLYGSSYLAVLTLPIPKGLWPEKPGLIPGMVGETFYGMDVGMPPGALGEAYWNFGIPGILIVFFLFGLFGQWLAATFRQYAAQPVAIVLYVITLFVLSEPSSMTVVMWLTTLLPAMIFLLSIGVLSLRSDPRN